MTKRTLAIAAGVLALTAITYFWFPGRTILRSDTQIYLPILEHLNDPALLAKDAMASRPHVRFTVYDEVARLLHAASGLPFEQIVMAEQFVWRAVGVLGTFLIATALGLPAPAAFLATCVVWLGAVVKGPTVLTVEYEPVPRGFALPFVLLSIGLAGHLRWTGAAIAAAVAFLFHPPTALAYCCALGAALTWTRRWRAEMALIVFAVVFIFVAFAPATHLESQQLLSRIDPQVEQIQRVRASYNFVSTWWPEMMWHYLLLFAFVATACARLGTAMSNTVRYFILLPASAGVLGIPATWILLEHVRWMFMAQFQPARYLVFVTLFAALLGAVAGAHAARTRRWLEAVVWFGIAFALPMRPNLFGADLPWQTAVIPLLLAVTAVVACELRNAPAIVAAGILPFFVIPSAMPELRQQIVRQPADDDLARWARGNTPVDSVFQFAGVRRGLEPGEFRARALRAIHVDWKGGGQVNFLPSFAPLWWARWQQFERPRPLGEYAAAGIDYVVFTRAAAPPGVPPAFANAKWVVIRTRDVPR